MIGSRARGDLLHEPAVPGKGWEGCHDLTGPRSLVCIAGELREREAARKARAARWRHSWLRKAAQWLRRPRKEGDRGPAGRTAGGSGADPDRPDADSLHSVYAALTHAQILARRAGHRELADALHALFLLDLTGNIAEVAPLVASVRASLQAALGDDSRAVN